MPRATDPAPAPRDSTQRLELRLPDVSGANGFLDELAAFLGIVPTNGTLGEIPPEEDVAETILFLCSDRSRMITGQSILVNGGDFMR